MNPKLDRRLYRALMRASFHSFAHQCFLELNPSRTFLDNWHVQVISSALENCLRGQTKRLIINLPPRMLKSLLCSIAFPAYWLGHHPSARIICASYGRSLAEKFSSDCRLVMATPWYQSAFPKTRLAATRQQVGDFETTAHGYRMATSIEGGTTGRGADLIIIDDPLKPDEALSDTQRRAANMWYDGTLYSRLDNKRYGCIIIVMQRLHIDDLVGHVLLNGQEWVVISLPAIAEQDECHRFTEVGRRFQHVRRRGEALHPGFEPIDILEETRKSLGSYLFSAQYQQEPVPLEGAIVKDRWLQYYASSDCPAGFDTVVASWDTASKANQLNDYSVCTIWGVLSNKVYLLHVYRERLEYPDLRRAVVTLAKQHRADVVLIEDTASGTQLIQELKYSGEVRPQAVKPVGEKVMRMQAQTPIFEAGQVLLPRDAPWLDVYRRELLTFPQGRHDDQVDSTAQALKWIQEARRKNPFDFDFGASSLGAPYADEMLFRRRHR